MIPTKATGIHFDQLSHSVLDVRITIIEQMKTRERYIKNKFKFNTYYEGINRMP
jgi:hypothetical protein